MSDRISSRISVTASPLIQETASSEADGLAETFKRPQVIIVIVVGATLIIALLFSLCYICKRRRLKKKQRATMFLNGRPGDIETNNVNPRKMAAKTLPSTSLRPVILRPMILERASSLNNKDVPRNASTIPAPLKASIALRTSSIQSIADTVKSQSCVPSTKELIESWIKTDQIVIFSKSWDPNCEKAKNLLRKLNIAFHSIELDKEHNGTGIQKQLTILTNRNTVPSIFISGKHIGGFSDLIALELSGALDEFMEHDSAILGPILEEEEEKEKEVLEKLSANLTVVESAIEEELGNEIEDDIDIDVQLGENQPLEGPSAPTIPEYVESLIKNNPVVLFSNTNCPFCKKAKQLLWKSGTQFFAIELDKESSGVAIQKYLQEKTRQSTVPNLFISDKHIGGYTDLYEFVHSGGLFSANL